jgi:cytochrome P450
VIVQDEQAHLRLRKLMLPPFHGERLQQWTDFVAKLTLEEIDAWPIGKPFPLRPISERITMSVITKIVFGLRDPARAAELRSLLPVLFDIPWLAAPGYVTALGRFDLGPFSPWGRFRRKRDRIDQLLYREIAERRREFEAIAEDDADPRARGDILSMLLTVRDEDGAPMTDRELRDQLVTMLVAGHETTSTALAWTLERLVRTPAVMEKLITSLDAGETRYLDAVIKESLRVRPVVAQIGRLLTRETAIDGWLVPARTMVVIPLTVIHRDPEIYPDPREFRPERFLDGNEPGDYAWLPFGGGVKRCLGASLALLEMRTALTTILSHVRLTADRPEPERPRVRGITVVPHRGGRIVVRDRIATPAPASSTVPA